MNILKAAYFPTWINAQIAWSPDRELFYHRIDRSGYMTSAAGFTGSYAINTNVNTWPWYNGPYRVSGRGSGTVWIGTPSFTVPNGAGVTGTAAGWQFDVTPPSNSQVQIRYRTSADAPNHLRDLAIVAHPHREDYDNGYIISPGFNGLANWRQLYKDTHGTLRQWTLPKPEHMGPTYGHWRNDPSWIGDPENLPEKGLETDIIVWDSWFDIGKFCGRPIEGAHPNPSRHVFPDPPAGFYYEPGETVWCQFPRGRAWSWAMYHCERGPQTLIKIRPLVAGEQVQTWFGISTVAAQSVFPILPGQVAPGEYMTFALFGTGISWTSRWQSGVQNPGHSQDDPNDTRIAHSEPNSDFDGSWTVILDRDTSWDTGPFRPDGLYAAGAEGPVRTVWPTHFVRIGNREGRPWAPVRQHALNSAAPYIIHSNGNISGANNVDAHPCACNYSTNYANYPGRNGQGHFAGGHNHIMEGVPVKIMIDICNECEISPGWNLQPSSSMDAPAHADRNNTWQETNQWVYKTALLCKQRLKPGLRPVFEHHTFRAWEGTLAGVGMHWGATARGWHANSPSHGITQNGMQEMSIVHTGQQLAAAYGITKEQFKSEAPKHFCNVYILPNRGDDTSLGSWASDIGFGPRVSGWRQRGGDPAYQWATHWSVEVAGVSSPYFSNTLRSRLDTMVAAWEGSGRNPNHPALSAFAHASNAQFYDPSRTYQGPREDGSVDLVHSNVQWTGPRQGPPLFFASTNVPVNTPPPNPSFWTQVANLDYHTGGNVPYTVIQFRNFLERFEAWMEEWAPEDPKLKFMGLDGGLPCAWVNGQPFSPSVGQADFMAASQKTAAMGEVERDRIAVFRDHDADGIPMNFAAHFNGGRFGHNGTGRMWLMRDFTEFGLDHPRWEALKEWALEDDGTIEPPSPEPNLPNWQFPATPQPNQRAYSRLWNSIAQRWDRTWQ